MPQPLKEEGWVVCADVLLVCLGLALIGFGSWNNLGFSNGWPIFLPGSMFCLGGTYYLGWKDSSVKPASEQVPLPGSTNVYLGSLDLNGHSIKTYECETDQGNKQFRLVAIPAVTHEKEAALIRYIVNEGLMENISLGMSKKIAEEAAWAFFP